MQIHVSCMYDNDKWTFDVEPTDTVKNIKTKIQGITEIPTPFQVLTFQGYVLEDESLLLMHDIKHNSTLFLQYRPRRLHTKNNDGNKATRYSFGHHATFWDPNDLYYIKPKYKDIYQELLSNNIFKLDRKQFNNITQHAKQVYIKFLKAKKREKWNKLCKIPPSTVMSVDHAVAIVASIHIDELYTKFMITLRSNNKAHRSEIAHFARLITESIKLYGTHTN
eukprot:441508_1